MKIISKEELFKYINFEEIYNDTKEGFVKFSKGETITPPYTIFNIPESNGSVHFKYGYILGSESFSFKYSGGFYNNEAKGLSNFLGLYIVFNAETGEAELVLDDKGSLTDYRTGIAGALTTKTLARENSKVVTVIGTGVEARMQVDALLKVMPGISTLNVYGRTQNNVIIYCEEMKAKYPNLDICPFSDVKEAVGNADIIYTTTFSSEPLLKSEWVKAGTHITAVGACGPEMQELDKELLKRANILAVDSKEACSSHGELHHAIDKGLVSIDDAIELGTVIDEGLKRKDEDITICDLVGLGFQDAVIGNCIYKNVLKEKIKTGHQL